MNRLRVYRQPISLLDKLVDLTDLALSDISNSMLLKEHNAWHVKSPVLGFATPLLGEIELFGLFLFGPFIRRFELGLVLCGVLLVDLIVAVLARGLQSDHEVRGLADIRRLVLKLNGAVLGALV